VTSVSISGGEFTIRGGTSVGIGSGCALGGTTTVSQVTISGGVFNIEQTLGPAIGAAYLGSTTTGSSSVPVVMITGGTFTAKTLGTNDPVIGSGARSGTGGSSRVAQIAISGGEFDLTAYTTAQGEVEALPPAIGFPNSNAIAADVRIDSISIADARFTVNAAYFIEGQDATTRIVTVEFLGSVTISFTTDRSPSALVYGASVAIQNGCTLAVVTPVRFIGTTVTLGQSSDAIVEILYSRDVSGTERDVFDSFPIFFVGFSANTLQGRTISLIAQPTADQYVGFSHEIVLDRTLIRAVFMSVPTYSTQAASYRLSYYVWSDGEVGSFCSSAGSYPQSWSIQGAVTSVTNLVTCGSTDRVATKTSRPRTVSRSQTPTVSPPTDHFTPIEDPYHTRRVFRTISLFVIGLAL
jgi:hypothetical protein